MHPEKDTAEAFLLRRAAKTGVPITGSFELTPLCNLNCKMCYVRMNRTEQEEISRLQTAEEWTALAEKLRDAGTLFLLLTGGEPLLYPAFRAVYLAVRKRGMIVTVNTNGTLLNEDWAAFFAKNPPRRVNVTLYGASGETYKSLCGDETGYTKAMRGIRLLQAHGVPGENILKEEKSESTQQNFEFSRALLEQAGIRADEPIAYVTNRFHIYRSGIFARKADFTNARAIPASISFGTIAPSYLREVLAVCHVWVFG